MHVVKTSYKEFQIIHFYVSIQTQDTSNHICIWNTHTRLLLHK